MDPSTLRLLAVELRKQGFDLTTEVIGKGTFGIVVKGYYSTDRRERRHPLAIKFLTSIVSESGLRHLESLPAAAAATSSEHRDLVEHCVLPLVYAGTVCSGTRGGGGGSLAPTTFLVSPFVFGGPESVRAFVTSLDTDLALVRNYMRGLLSALAWARDHGIVHRDIKPRNIMFNSFTRQAFLGDWGLADSAVGMLRLDPDQLDGDEGSGADLGAPKSGAAPASAWHPRMLELSSQLLRAAGGGSEAAAALGRGSHADGGGGGGGSSSSSSSIFATSAAASALSASSEAAGAGPLECSTSKQQRHTVGPSGKRPAALRHDGGTAGGGGRLRAQPPSVAGPDPGANVVDLRRATCEPPLHTPDRRLEKPAAAASRAPSSPAAVNSSATGSAPPRQQQQQQRRHPQRHGSARSSKAPPSVLQPFGVPPPLPQPSSAAAAAPASGASIMGAPAASALQRIKRLDLMERRPEEQRAYAQLRLDRELKAARAQALERAVVAYKGQHRGFEPPLDTRRLLEAKAHEEAARAVTKKLAISGELKRRADKAGTPGFRAPEVLLGCSNQGPPVDVWSAGLVMLGLLTRSYPLLPGRDDGVHLLCLYSLWGDTLRAAASSMGRHMATWPVDHVLLGVARSPVAGILPLCAPDMLADAAFPAAFDLCLRLLHPDPEKRMSANAALQCHPFFTLGSPPRAAPAPHAVSTAAGSSRATQPPPARGAASAGAAHAAVDVTAYALLPACTLDIAHAYCADDEVAAVAQLIEQGKRQRAEHAARRLSPQGSSRGAQCAPRAPSPAAPLVASAATRTGDAGSHQPRDVDSSSSQGDRSDGASRAAPRRAREQQRQSGGGSERGARHRQEEADVQRLAAHNIDEAALQAGEDSTAR